MNFSKDPVLTAIVRHLTDKYKCHTVILYGSRARGSTTATSDYDVVGVRSRGTKTRVAKKQNGFYWDVFVYSEKELRKLGNEQMGWRDAIVLVEKKNYGRNLVKRLTKLVTKPYKPLPAYQIKVLKVWAQKELERCAVRDIHGMYRRAEFHNALVEHYFDIRKKRFWGPKAGIIWLKDHDPKMYKLLQRTLKKPSKLEHLRAAASYVYKVKLK